MKPLFDDNLSSVLLAALADCYGESRHVRDVGLKASSDADVSVSGGGVFCTAILPKSIWIGLGF